MTQMTATIAHFAHSKDQKLISRIFADINQVGSSRYCWLRGMDYYERQRFAAGRKWESRRCEPMCWEVRFHRIAYGGWISVRV